MSERVLTYFLQRPEERLDYDFDFTNFLGTDTISTYAVTVTSGLTIDGTTTNYPTIKLWVRGGTTGQDYILKVKITTAAGRIKDMECVIQIRVK